MSIKRLLVVTAIAAGVAAPTAAARVATEPLQSTAGAPQHLTLAGPESRFAAIAAHRDGITTRQWQQAEQTRPVTLVQDTRAGFDWTSVLLGGSVPLALILLASGLRSGPLRRPTRSALV